MVEAVVEIDKGVLTREVKVDTAKLNNQRIAGSISEPPRTRKQFAAYIPGHHH